MVYVGVIKRDAPYFGVLGKDNPEEERVVPGLGRTIAIEHPFKYYIKEAKRNLRGISARECLEKLVEGIRKEYDKIPIPLRAKDAKNIFEQYLAHNVYGLFRFLKGKEKRRIKKGMGFFVADIDNIRPVRNRLMAVSRPAGFKYGGRFGVLVHEDLAGRVEEFRKNYGWSKKETIDYLNTHELIHGGQSRYKIKHTPEIKLERATDMRVARYYSFLIREVKRYARKIKGGAKEEARNLVARLKTISKRIKYRAKKEVPKIYAPVPAKA